LDGRTEGETMTLRDEIKELKDFLYRIIRETQMEKDARIQGFPRIARTARKDRLEITEDVRKYLKAAEKRGKR
jgi:hypothetical protein